MKHYFQAEQLKYRHTSVAAITLGMPMFTALLAFWLTSSYFSIDVYNWWYIGLYPGFLGILCSIIGKKGQTEKELHDMVTALRHGTDLGRKNPCRNKDVGGCSCWTYAVFHDGADAAGICGESEDEAGNPDSGTDTGRDCVVAYHTLGDSVLPASCTENKHISDACDPCWNL